MTGTDRMQDRVDFRIGDGPATEPPIPVGGHHTGDPQSGKCVRGRVVTHPDSSGQVADRDAGRSMQHQQNLQAVLITQQPEPNGPAGQLAGVVQGLFGLLGTFAILKHCPCHARHFPGCRFISSRCPRSRGRVGRVGLVGGDVHRSILTLSEAVEDEFVIPLVAAIMAMLTLPLATVRDRLSALVDDVTRSHDTLTTTHNGTPAVVVLSVDDYESIMKASALLNDPIDQQCLVEAERSVDEGDVTGDKDMGRLVAERIQGATGAT